MIHYLAPIVSIKTIAICISALYIISNLISCQENKINDIESYRLSFFSREHNEVNIDLVNFPSLDSLYTYLSINNIYFKISKHKHTISFIDREKNNKITDSVINMYQWSKQLPDSLVIKYLTPIRLGKEYVSDWKSFFFKKYKKDLDSLNKIRNINRVEVAKFLLNDISKWYNYNEHILNIRYPDLQNLLFTSSGDCYRIAYMYTMCLRACGIPAAVDMTPLWGNNLTGGHSEVTTLNNFNVFETNVNTLHKNGLKGAPKVYRLLDGCDEFKWLSSFEVHEDISFLKDIAYMDVTKDHTETTTINIVLPLHLKDNIAYLCVLNGNKWHPIFPAKIINGNVIFDHVGVGNEYRIATMCNLPLASYIQN